MCFCCISVCTCVLTKSFHFFKINWPYKGAMCKIRQEVENGQWTRMALCRTHTSTKAKKSFSLHRLLLCYPADKPADQWRKKNGHRWNENITFLVVVPHVGIKQFWIQKINVWQRTYQGVSEGRIPLHLRCGELSVLEHVRESYEGQFSMPKVLTGWKLG